MSRSYKKTPRSGDRKDKYFKRYANRRLRRMSLEHLDLKGKSYKKTFCSWNICDYETVGTSFEQYWLSVVRSWHRWQKELNEPFPDREQTYQDYIKWFKRK